MCGVVNTLFGYFISIGLYSLLRDILATVMIVVIAKIMAITFSYITYKIFIFKTKGRWLYEYLRCYVSYGLTSLITISILVAMVDYVGVPFWIAQLFTICVGSVFSFIAHNYYTFSHQN